MTIIFFWLLTYSFMAWKTIMSKIWNKLYSKSYLKPSHPQKKAWKKVWKIDSSCFFKKYDVSLATYFAKLSSLAIKTVCDIITHFQNDVYWSIILLWVDSSSHCKGHFQRKQIIKFLLCEFPFPLGWCFIYIFIR